MVSIGSQRQPPNEAHQISLCRTNSCRSLKRLEERCYLGSHKKESSVWGVGGYPGGHILCLKGAATTQLEQTVTMQKLEPNLPFISYFQEKPEIYMRTLAILKVGNEFALFKHALWWPNKTHLLAR